MSSTRKSAAARRPANANDQVAALRLIVAERDTQIEKLQADLAAGQQELRKRDEDLKEAKAVGRLANEVYTRTSARHRHQLEIAQADIEALTRRVSTLSAYQEMRRQDDVVERAVRLEKDFHDKRAAEGMSKDATHGA